MKKFLNSPFAGLAFWTGIAFALWLAAWPAMANNHVFAYRSVSAQHLNYVSTVRAITAPIDATTEAVRLTCTTACLFAISVSDFAGNGPTESLYLNSRGVTTYYLAADKPVIHKISGKSGIYVVQVSSAGVLHVEELSR